MRNTCSTTARHAHARPTHPIVVHTHTRSGEGWANWGDPHEGYGVGLAVEYLWHRALRNTLWPQRGQRSGNARLSSGPHISWIVVLFGNLKEWSEMAHSIPFPRITYHKFVMFLVVQNLCKICAKFVQNLCKNLAPVRSFAPVQKCRTGAKWASYSM